MGRFAAGRPTLPRSARGTGPQAQPRYIHTPSLQAAHTAGLRQAPYRAVSGRLTGSAHTGRDSLDQPRGAPGRPPTGQRLPHIDPLHMGVSSPTVQDSIQRHRPTGPYAHIHCTPTVCDDGSCHVAWFRVVPCRPVLQSRPVGAPCALFALCWVSACTRVEVEPCFWWVVPVCSLCVLCGLQCH